jgi:hypothetical protein
MGFDDASIKQCRMSYDPGDSKTTNHYKASCNNNLGGLGQFSANGGSRYGGQAIGGIQGNSIGQNKVNQNLLLPMVNTASIGAAAASISSSLTHSNAKTMKLFDVLFKMSQQVQN